ncbi:heterokaryon incompatibility protein-domain-containing protein [Penicillium verhagenii]|nr:heterokaryon incompatibility protein-domain-containing protein [Penicillium verhagenii]
MLQSRWRTRVGAIKYAQRIGESDSEATIGDDDLKPTFSSCDGNEAEIEGWLMELDIRTEPFSESFVLGREESIATVIKEESRHSNTLSSGRYTRLVIKRRLEILLRLLELIWKVGFDRDTVCWAVIG